MISSAVLVGLTVCILIAPAVLRSWSSIRGICQGMQKRWKMEADRIVLKNTLSPTSSIHKEEFLAPSQYHLLPYTVDLPRRSTFMESSRFLGTTSLRSDTPKSPSPVQPESIASSRRFRNSSLFNQDDLRRSSSQNSTDQLFGTIDDL